MRSLVVGTAGHIDHGKSALVQALTGTDPDRLKEEKARGITIDLGFAHTAIRGTTFAFVDVPGHERFVKNMLAGVGGIDLVVLVVAADESVMPQTREHFEICRLLRVPSGLVVLSKADLVDEETLSLARLEVQELVAGSFLEGAPVIAASARTGAGLDIVRSALVDAAAKAVHRPTDGAARLPIDRVFSMKGFGTVVTGTLVSGQIAIDDQLAIAPGALRVRVRGVQVHGQSRNAAVAGERCAVNVAGVELADVARGQVLIAPGAFVETRIADVKVELLAGAKPLRHGARVRVHQGSAETLARVGMIGAVPAIPPGRTGYARLRLESPTVLARGDWCIIRAYSPPETIAGAHVLDPFPPRDRIRLAAAATRLAALDEDAGDQASQLRAAALMVRDAGAAALPRAALVWRVGVPPAAAVERERALEASGAAAVVGDVLVDPAIPAQLEERILAALAENHRADPNSEGLPREELRARTFRRGNERVFDHAITRLARDGKLLLRDRVGLAGHESKLSNEESRAQDALSSALREAGLAPAELPAVAAALGIGGDAAERLVRLLQRQQAVVRVGPFWYHADVLRRLKAEVSATKRRDAQTTLDVAGFKDRYGLTRKHAIPLLEYLDRERVTRRSGETRIVL